MKVLQFLILFFSVFIFGQEINSIQIFNPKTNDETPIISFNEQLILNFDDFSNSSEIYRYTFKHQDRNWEDDQLFFTEFAEGSLNGLINDFHYSFNTIQKYTHYTLAFPNERMRPKISGNFLLIVYKDSPDKPLFTRKFCVSEDGAVLGINISRITDARNPDKSQKVEVSAIGKGSALSSNLNSISLNVIQNNNFNLGVFHQKISSNLGNQVLFQQMNLVFPGNNEFYYFDNKIINQSYDMVSGTERVGGFNYTYLFPVWAYPMNYQNQGDVNGAFYFRRNDTGTERNADNEGDYSWVYFSLDAAPTSKKIYVLGVFNEYIANDESEMKYDEVAKKYVAKIYLKQGFYNYILGTKEDNKPLNLGEINGNFWQTENLYQAFLYYKPFGRSYDGLLGYGENRKRVRP